MCVDFHSKNAPKSSQSRRLDPHMYVWVCEHILFIGNPFGLVPLLCCVSSKTCTTHFCPSNDVTHVSPPLILFGLGSVLIDGVVVTCRLSWVVPGQITANNTDPILVLVYQSQLRLLLSAFNGSGMAWDGFFGLFPSVNRPG